MKEERSKVKHVYYDDNGGVISLFKLVKTEPEWAVNRIRMADEIVQKYYDLQVQEAKYNDLIMTVGNKYPGESRHETAKRYIVEAETSSGPATEAQ